MEALICVLSDFLSIGNVNYAVLCPTVGFYSGIIGTWVRIEWKLIVGTGRI